MGPILDFLAGGVGVSRAAKFIAACISEQISLNVP